MEIEKKIYYCWFGKGEKSAAIESYIASWAQQMPTYEIVEINESNFDIDAFPYTRTAYAAKRYAFVSDCARVYYLQTYGGIYLDTDVEIRKDLTPLLAATQAQLLLSQERYEGELTGVNTSVLISMKRCKLWEDLLKYYNTNEFKNEQEPETINQRISRLLVKHSGFVYEDKAQQLDYRGDVIAIIEAKYLMLDTNEAYAIHHLAGTWKQDLSFARKIRRRGGHILKRVIGKRGFERLWNKQKK